MRVPLPADLTVEKWTARVRAEQGAAYAPAVSRMLGYLDGNWEADTRSAITAVMPATGPTAPLVGIPVVERVSEAKAVVFDGSPRFTIEDATTDEPIEETAAGTSFEDVLRAAHLTDVLQRVDERTVGARLAFVRATWDAVAGRVRLDVFDAPNVFPLYDVDRPDLATSPGVLLKLADDHSTGTKVERYELWTASADGTDARHLIIDEKGELVRVPGDDESNPYRGPDGVRPLVRADDSYPILPLVAFGDLGAGPWPMPRQSLIDGQRTVNIRATNLAIVELLQGHGQWIDTKADANAQDWSGAPVAGTERQRLLRGESRPTGVTTLQMGPERVISVPAGHTLTNVAMGSQLGELRQGFEVALRTVCTSEGLPAGVLVDTARNASGVALLVERAPLNRYREKRVAAFHDPVVRLVDLIRIVWNTYAAENDQFVSPGGVHVDFKPDRMGAVRDPREVVEVAAKKQALGLYSAAEIRAEADGIPVAEAADRIRKRDAEDGPREAARRMGRVVIAPRAPTPPVPDSVAAEADAAASGGES